MRSAVGVLFLLIILVGTVPKVEALAPECSYSFIYNIWMMIYCTGCDYNGFRERCCPTEGRPLHEDYHKCLKLYYMDDFTCYSRIVTNNDGYNYITSFLIGGDGEL